MANVTIMCQTQVMTVWLYVYFMLVVFGLLML